jgi:hypothetical protein
LFIFRFRGKKVEIMEGACSEGPLAETLKPIGSINILATGDYLPVGRDDPPNSNKNELLCSSMYASFILFFSFGLGM